MSNDGSFEDALSGGTSEQDHNLMDRTFLRDDAGFSEQFLINLETWCDSPIDIYHVFWMGGFSPEELLSLVENQVDVEPSTKEFKRMISFHHFSKDHVPVTDGKFDWHQMIPNQFKTYHKLRLNYYRRDFQAAVALQTQVLLEEALERGFDDKNNTTPLPTDTKLHSSHDQSTRATNGGGNETRPVYSGDTRVKETPKTSTAGTRQLPAPQPKDAKTIARSLEQLSLDNANSESSPTLLGPVSDAALHDFSRAAADGIPYGPDGSRLNRQTDEELYGTFDENDSTMIRLRNPLRYGRSGDESREGAGRPAPLLLKRNSMSEKITFDGKYDNFRPFKSQYVSHLIQNNLGYMIKPLFLETYAVHGMDSLLHYVDPTTGSLLKTTQRQFAADRSYGYGCLMSALRKGTASHMTLAFEDTEDGIGLWMSLRDKFDDDEVQRILRSQWSLKLQQPYNARGKTTLADFVEGLQEAYIHLQQAGRDYSNDHKMEVLYGRLRASGDKNTMDLVRTCETIPTITSFDKACLWFISQDRIESHFHSNTAKVKAHVAESLFYDAQEPTSADDTLFDEFYTLMAAQHDDKYHLPSNVFRSLSREARTMFYQMRDDLTKAQKQLDDKTPGTRGENGGVQDKTSTTTLTDGKPKPKVDFKSTPDSGKPTPLPQQYPKAVKANLADTTMNQETFEETLGTKERVRAFLKDFDAFREQNRRTRDQMHFMACVEPTDIRTCGRLDNVPSIEEQTLDRDPRRIEPVPRRMTVNEVKVQHFDCHAKLGLVEGEYRTVSDDGAMSFVCGKGWRIMAVDPRRKVNLVGADSDSMRKNGLDVVTAISKVQPLTGPPVLFRVHESPSNPTSPVTLMSEYQCREFGCIVDSVAKHHRTVDGYGTQSFRPKDDVIVPFDITSALMSFRHQYPTDDDLENLRMIDITADFPWNPSTHSSIHDEDIPPVHANQTIVVNHTMTQDSDGLYYFDPSDALCRATGKAVHLAIDYECFLRESSVDIFLDTLSDRELKGRTFECDSFLLALQAAIDLREGSNTYEDGDVDIDKEIDELFRTINHADFAALCDLDFSHIDFAQLELDAFEDALETHEMDQQTMDTFTAFLATNTVDGAANDAMKSVIEEAMDPKSGVALENIPDDIMDVIACLQRAKYQVEQLERYQPYLGYMPIQVVRETFARTTQMAKAVLSFPMSRHFKSRFKWMNRMRLREAVAMDTFFANTTAYGGGETCAQVFYGVTSHVINVYGMKSESHVPDAYRDFLRNEGIPTVLRRDNAKVQTGAQLTAINRDYLIKDGLTEPHHPQQNPAESRAVKWLKRHVKVLMDRCGAPPKMWLLAAKYLADINNFTADESLRWEVPYTVRHGETVDISAFLNFRFYEKVLYSDPNSKFPESNELPGYWGGVAHCCGDALTYYILTEDAEWIITRSVVRALDPSKPNQRVDFDTNLDPDMPHVNEDGAELQLDGNYLKKPKKVEQYRRSLKKKQRRRARRRTNTTDSNTIDQGSAPSPTVPPSPSVPTVSVPPTTTTVIPPTVLPVTVATPNSALPSTPATIPTASEDIPLQMPQVTPPSSDSESGEDSDSGEEDTKSRLDDKDYVPSSKPNGDKCNVRRSTRLRTQRKTSLLGLAMSTASILSAGVNATMFQGPTFDSHHMEEHVHIPEPAEPVIFGDRYDDHVANLSTAEMNQLQYVQMVDMHDDIIQESFGEADMNWTPVAVLDHKQRKIRDDDIHVKLLMQWANGETSWQRMDDVRYQDPYVVTRYAMDNELSKHPDFQWVSLYANDSKNHRIFNTATKPGKRPSKYKFGTQVPMNVRHALKLDQMNGNHEWRDAIAKELKQINDYETFRTVTNEDNLDDYTQVPYHIVFDVKFDLRRKARLVANGGYSDTTQEEVYSGVVAMDTMRLAFQVAAMNDLQCCAADVGNAFLYGKTRELCYIIAGSEFGELQGQPLIIDKGLYGLRTSAARFHEHMAAQLREMKFEPTLFDADLWIRDCGGHYEYVATYVDDILAFSKDPMKIINTLKSRYILKGVGEPEYYLGGNIDVLDESWQRDGVNTALSASTYIKNVVNKLEQLFERSIPFATTPMAEAYHPELDETPLLEPGEASKFRTLTGSANWVITLGRFDIAYATMALSRFSMAPREGHLKAMTRVFGYLKRRPDGKLLCDPNMAPHEDHVSPPEHNWSEFYPDATEELPPKFPTPKGKEANITCYVDADHAHDQLTRRSVTGILMYVNGMPIKWMSKRQRTVESSTYGSELVAARLAVDMIVEMRYALRLMGVPIVGPALMLGDNMSVVLNTTVPSSVLKKKHCSISYHRVREAIAGGICRFAHVASAENIADILTKPVNKTAFYHLSKKSIFRVPTSVSSVSEGTSPDNIGVVHDDVTGTHKNDEDDVRRGAVGTPGQLS